ncbi:hypothetical protein [Streptomyces sp. NPDC005181]|uniref:hypothetical protein n=1 Tax=Streptomyces sp. NPDC005181 TaxID=3156869 RepID=UPI0033ABCB0C
MSKIADAEIAEFIYRVVHDGSNYRMTAMEKLHTADMSILSPSKEGAITRAPREDVFGEFAARGSNGDAPLSTEYKILHIEEQGDHATALLYRRMSDASPPFLYELRLRRDAQSWRVSGETVTPWPDPRKAGTFLPPRQNA